MHTSKNKVVLVEDNPADVELTKLVYSDLDADIELVHYFDGHQLIESLPSLSLTEICYILLDLNMPKLSGIDVLKIFSGHEEWRKIPVIVFTSSHHLGDVSSCYNHGVNAYVTKPVDIEDFETTIRKIHEFWGNLNLRPNFNHVVSANNQDS